MQMHAHTHARAHMHTQSHTHTQFEREHSWMEMEFGINVQAVRSEVSEFSPPPFSPTQDNNVPKLGFEQEG